MNGINGLLTALSTRLKALAKSNAVVARTITVGDRHVLPLCEIALGFGGGGGQAEADAQSKGAGKGTGGMAGGMAKAAPVAVIVVDGGQVRVESLVR